MENFAFYFEMTRITVCPVHPSIDECVCFVLARCKESDIIEARVHVTSSMQNE